MRIVETIDAHIFEDKWIGGNCSNNGISARFDEVLIICEDGWIPVDLDNPPENLCVFVERKLFGDEANYIRPYAEPKGAGWMYGGSLIYSSDSRFPGRKPLCFHDRQESWEMYDLLSR